VAGFGVKNPDRHRSSSNSVYNLSGVRLADDLTIRIGG